jgi:threonine aldolase
VIPGNGLFGAEQAAERLRRPTPNTPGTALVWVENTHNLGGGLIFPLDEIRRLAALCREHGVPLHMDGARVFNAAIATGTPAAEIAAAADSLSFCLSKGLGAPVGSLLCGTRAFREQAHRFRKMLGGGMRQAGVLAAAGIFALRHNVERLAEDHANAKRLAAGLAGTPGLRIHAAGVQTNIVMASFEGDAAGLSARCGERGVLFHALGPHRLRFVTHLDVDATGIDRAVEVVRGESDAGVRA